MAISTARTDQVGKIIRHLQLVVKVFNDQAVKCRLPIRLDAEFAAVRVLAGLDLDNYTNIWKDKMGVMEIPYIRAAVECIVELWKNDRPSGYVTGAREAGRQTTSLALQFAGPAFYLFSGIKLLPVLLTSTSPKRKEFIQLETHQFLKYYGKLTFSLVDKVKREHGDLDEVFKATPTLQTYNKQILLTPENNFGIPSMDQVVESLRAREVATKKLHQLFQQTAGRGYLPLLVIRQGDFSKKATTDQPESFLQLFQWIGAELGPQNKNYRVIGLSRPSLLQKDLLHVWQVSQLLDKTL
ncbi:hypothetical protein [Dinghuibacter silviterrae]|uniref:Uncharacterized protein n=1 Tax=Dinghuibacter silviterrae TaxID=1539049 RepID=A0A4R8DJG5_9BACT|nr:hypothetical protein [Dinghuibacter silviterrae]TDW97140.1 hypothetical protein EDB95_4981 [Dinghuibacter silviterrae]